MTSFNAKSRIFYGLIGVAGGIAVGVPVVAEIVARNESAKMRAEAPDIELQNRDTGYYHLPTADRSYDLRDGMTPPTTDVREGL